MFICTTCNQNFCLTCKLEHDKSHYFINYKEKNYICKSHNRLYDSYCQTCKKNICIICYSDHLEHEIESYGYMIPKPSKLSEDILNLGDLINNLNKQIDNIINKLNKVKSNFEIYLKLKTNIICNFNNRYINYEILHNLKKIKNNKLVNTFNSLNKENDIMIKFQNIMKIYEKMTNKNNNNDKSGNNNSGDNDNRGNKNNRGNNNNKGNNDNNNNSDDNKNINQKGIFNLNLNLSDIEKNDDLNSSNSSKDEKQLLNNIKFKSKQKNGNENLKNDKTNGNNDIDNSIDIKNVNNSMEEEDKKEEKKEKRKNEEDSFSEEIKKDMENNDDDDDLYDSSYSSTKARGNYNRYTNRYSNGEFKKRRKGGKRFNYGNYPYN